MKGISDTCRAWSVLLNGVVTNMYNATSKVVVSFFSCVKMNFGLSIFVYFELLMIFTFWGVSTVIF